MPSRVPCEVVVMRLRMGHNRLNAHMFKKMKLAPSPIRNGGLEDQTAEHTLQMCPLLQTARTNVWPTAVQLHTKLYGSMEGLEKTATFILQTGLSVWRRSRRRSVPCFTFGNFHWEKSQVIFHHRKLVARITQPSIMEPGIRSEFCVDVF